MSEESKTEKKFTFPLDSAKSIKQDRDNIRKIVRKIKELKAEESLVKTKMWNKIAEEFPETMNGNWELKEDCKEVHSKEEQDISFSSFLDNILAGISEEKTED